jgi:hypothetical protein
MAVSDADISSFVQANIDNPQAIADAAQQYGVSAADLSRATGYDAGTVSNYFGNAGINMWDQPAAVPFSSTPTGAPATPQNNPYASTANALDTSYVQPTFAPAPLAQTPANGATGIASLPTTTAPAPAPVVAPAPTPTVAPLTAAPIVPSITKSTAIPSITTPAAVPSITAPAVEPKFGTVTPYGQTEIKNYVSGVMADPNLSSWEKTNKIMEAAQQAGISQNDLSTIYGKNVVDPYVKDYGTGIKSYITNTLADTKKSDFEKLASINQAANKYGLDQKEISDYSGLSKTGVDSMFKTFDTGLASIVKNLSAPTVSDLDKTKGALTLKNMGVTDDQIAKALGGTVTGKDVTAYLAPVKDFGTNLQAITSDSTKTARDLQAFIDNAKKDPRIEGLYGLAIDKVQQAVPILGLRDAMSGTGTPEQITKGYTDFVAAVNANPALRQQYGAQADAIQKVADLSQRIADEKYGGKLQPHMFETFLGLDQKSIANVPKQLETSKPQTVKEIGEDGLPHTYTVQGQVIDTKGLNPVYTDDGLAGYTKEVKTAAGVTVDAQYDLNGTLTGYRGRAEDRIWPQGNVAISGNWDADGKAHPEQQVQRGGGFFKGVMQDFSQMGPIGQIALMAATGGLGSLAAGALEGALGSTLANAVGSGLVSGTMSEMGGKGFGKGFATGAIGNPVQAITQGLVGQLMPNIDTGNTTVNQYIQKALPNLASSEIGALLNKQDLGKTGLTSLLNTGANMATSNLINTAMPDTLTPEMQKMFTGVSGQLLSGLLQGQSPDIQKAVMNTIMQNAMSQSKTTAKEKG